MAVDPNEGMPVLRGTVRVAVVQASPVMFDARKSIQKLADLTADAARSGARLVVFPEAFVAGYPKGHDFGVGVGLRSPEGRDEFRRLFEEAIEVPGEATEAIGKVAGTTPSTSSSAWSSGKAGPCTARRSSSAPTATCWASTAS